MPQLAFRQRALVQSLLERTALLVAERDVTGAIELEEPYHLHDIAMAQARHQSRLVEKRRYALLELLLIVGGLRPHRRIGSTPRQIVRQIFLDRDGFMQVGIERPIGDAEAAMAEHGVDAEFLQHRAGAQRKHVQRNLIACHHTHPRSRPYQAGASRITGPWASYYARPPAGHNLSRAFRWL